MQQFSHQNRRVGVFIDVQNMYYSARNMYGSKVNFGNIVKTSIGNQQLVRAIAYTISTKTGDELPFFEALHKMGIEVNMKELLEYEGGQKKGDWDVGITVDIIRMLDMVDVVVLVSGDGDYIPLGEYIKNRGRVFHVVSFRESTSSKLVDCADVYTNLSDNLGQYLIRDPHYRPQTHRVASVTDTFSDVIAEQGENRVLTFPEKPAMVFLQQKNTAPKPPQAPAAGAAMRPPEVKPPQKITHAESVIKSQNSQKKSSETPAKKRRGRPKKNTSESTKQS
jgi:uncharacterized LabA/DUF88 family protein